MIKKLHYIFLLISSLAFSQGITVNTSSYTYPQLVTDVLVGSDCGSVSNFTTQVGNSCGIGYFNSAGTSFPFAEGIIIASGNVSGMGGPINDGISSTTCSNIGDTDLQAVSTANGSPGAILDASFIQFNIIPESNILSFNFIFASNEYGVYQCSFGDVFAFLLTDLSTGAVTNLAVIPGTTIPVSVTTIRDNAYNSQCPSMNPQWFGQYNSNSASTSPINLRGQTVPMTAMADVIPGNAYSLKLVIGDYMDTAFDSAVFIEGGSLAFQNQCDDNIRMMAYVDANSNNIKDNDESVFTNGTFTHQVNNTGNVIENVSSLGTVTIYPENTTDSFDLGFTVGEQFAPYYTTPVGYSDITIVEGSGTNIYYFPVVNTVPYGNVSGALIPISEPRATEMYVNRIAYTNNGSLPASGTISFTETSFAPIFTVSAPGSVVVNDNTYNFDMLQPAETRYIDITMHVLPYPVTFLGQMLTNTVSITSNEADIDLSDNGFSLTQEIVGSFDPNDITESHGREIQISSFSNDDYLDYTIRFQNLGTASAYDVQILDMLDPQLDETTIEMIDASHDYTMERIGAQLNWRFDNIFLPAAVQDEPGSHGYVHFRIKPKAGFAVGDIIPNTAGIYFDSNPVVQTNVFETEFVNTLGGADFNNYAIRVYPNPATSVLNIVSANAELENLRIIDMTGKTIFTKIVSGHETSISIDAIQNGVYVLEITAGGKSAVSKLAIQ